ncbi:MAG TPA: hypothetical protein VGX68_29095 [Thermoanaerobaculia bacterium]|jgi:hypothetical protein|nr:hypothetical protein [Thermoanaerobaculia bacterium]
MSRAALVSILLLAAGPALAQESPVCQPGQSVREEDPATGVVVQKTRLEPRPDRFDPLLIWTSDEPDSVMLALVGNGAILKYRECFDLTLLADGRPIAVGKPEYNGGGSGGRVVEYVTADITWHEAERLAAAKAIRYRICHDEFTADDAFVCQAREVIGSAAAWRKAKASGRGGEGLHPEIPRIRVVKHQR